MHFIISNIPDYLKWLYWGNHMTYLISAILVVMFEDMTCDFGSTGVPVCKYI